MRTSRGLVALHGAHRIAVDQLPLPDAVALLRRLVGPRVAADPASAEALAKRCVRLPLTWRLAAELAVSRPAVPLSRLVDELRAALDVLSSGSDKCAAVRAALPRWPTTRSRRLVPCWTRWSVRTR